MLKTRKNLTTDKEQYTRSNAATARPLNLNIRLTENKQAAKNGDVNNHIAEHHLQRITELTGTLPNALLTVRTTTNDSL